MKNFLRNLNFIAILFFAMAIFSCSKDDPEIKPHDVELKFSIFPGGEYTDEIESIDNLRDLAADQSVSNIYLTIMEDNFFDATWTASSFGHFRDNLEERFAISPKIKGRGNMNCYTPLRCEPEDSLWFVEHGWTINKQLQNP